MSRPEAGESARLLAGGGPSSYGAAPDGGGGGDKLNVLTARQRILLTAVVAVQCALNGSLTALIVPFFPAEASDRGAPQTVISGVFSCFALGQLLTFPVAAGLLSTLGVRRLFQLGALVAALATLAFGTLYRVADPTWFMVSCCLALLTQAAGAATVTTAAFTLAAGQPDGRTGLLLGGVEMASSLGLALAPPLGGALYTVGGFRLPFFVVGGAMLAVVLFSLCALPSLSPRSPSAGDVRARLRTFAGSLDNWLCCGVVLTTGAVGGTLDATLAPYADDALGVGPSELGLYFLVSGSFYVANSLMWGWLAGRGRNPYPLVTGCLMTTALGTLLVAPSPVLDVRPSRWLMALGMAVQEASMGGAYLPCLQRLLTNCHALGLDRSVATQALVAAAFETAFALGNVLGPVAAGLIVDAFNFPVMMTCVAALTFVASAATAGMAAYVSQQEPGATPL